jgi:hypothetical protein
MQLFIPKEIAEHLEKEGRLIKVTEHTLRHEEHREALSEQVSEQFKMRKKKAREFVERVAEETGLKE